MNIAQFLLVYIIIFCNVAFLMIMPGNENKPAEVSDNDWAPFRDDHQERENVYGHCLIFPKQCMLKWYVHIYCISYRKAPVIDVHNRSTPYFAHCTYMLRQILKFQCCDIIPPSVGLFGTFLHWNVLKKCRYSKHSLYLWHIYDYTTLFDIVLYNRGLFWILCNLRILQCTMCI